MRAYFFFPASKGRCSSFNAERQRSNKTVKVKTTKADELRNASPLTRLVEVKLLFLDEEVEE